MIANLVSRRAGAEEIISLEILDVFLAFSSAASASIMMKCVGTGEVKVAPP